MALQGNWVSPSRNVSIPNAYVRVADVSYSTRPRENALAAVIHVYADQAAYETFNPFEELSIVFTANRETMPDGSVRPSAPEMLALCRTREGDPVGISSNALTKRGLYEWLSALPIFAGFTDV